MIERPRFRTEIKPRTVEVVWERPDLFKHLGNLDYRRALNVLSDPARYMSYVEGAEGRNVWVRSQKAEGDFTHLQLSGGFYRPLTLASEHALALLGETITNPSRKNFVTGRENMFGTLWYDERGVLDSTDSAYEPTGGYMREDAQRKANSTMTVEKRFGDSHVDNIVVPQTLFVYGVPTADLGPLEVGMVYGICFKTVDPKLIFHHYFNTNRRNIGRNPELKKQMTSRLLDTVWGGAYAMRTIHDLGLTHGQMGIGNLSLVDPSHVGNVFVKDWDTQRVLPRRPQAALLSRSLELIKLFVSSSAMSRALFRYGSITEDELYPMLLRLFEYTLSGYLAKDISQGTLLNVDSSEINDLIVGMLKIGNDRMRMHEVVGSYAEFLNRLMLRTGKRKGKN